MKQELIEKYAELVAKTGANVQPGQYVVIRTDVSQEYFASLVAKECYKLGAKRVFVHWQSAKLTSVDYNEAKEENLYEVPSFEEECQAFMAKHTPILIWIDADDPDGMKDLDSAKMARVKAEKYKVIGKYVEARQDQAQWCICGYPSKAWAEKVFPQYKGEEAMEHLLEAILETSRALDGNGIENWNRHEEDLKKRCAHLNSLKLRKLHYTSEKGTDFTVGLIPDVIFLGGGERGKNGFFFQPNIPSEECFTSPKRGEAEGIVYASKPLVYQGKVIENFSIRFHEGKAVEVHAEKNEDVLNSILSLDEGASYLGECALVPFDSPINNTGLLFFNTLYDENASCHLAIGRGFNSLVPGYENMSDDELFKLGINRSMSHVDFMIGDETLSIVGTTEEGKEVQIFKDGNWAF